MMEKNAKIYVAGHRGMVGSAIVRELERQGYTNIITRTLRAVCSQASWKRQMRHMPLPRFPVLSTVSSSTSSMEQIT